MRHFKIDPIKTSYSYKDFENEFEGIRIKIRIPKRHHQIYYQLDDFKNWQKSWKTYRKKQYKKA